MKIMDKVLDSLGLFEEEELEEIEESQPPVKTKGATKPRKSSTVKEIDLEKESLEPVRLVSSPRKRREKVVRPMVEMESDSGAVSRSSVPGQVILASPKNFESAQEIADHMRENRAVLMNFEGTEYEIARRIVDFISGVAYALNGNIKKVGQGVFLCAPYDIEVNYDIRSNYKGADTSDWDDRDFEKYFNR
jgi:Uncharacterized protein conserved in bacteria